MGSRRKSGILELDSKVVPRLGIAQTEVGTHYPANKASL